MPVGQESIKRAAKANSKTQVQEEAPGVEVEKKNTGRQTAGKQNAGKQNASKKKADAKPQVISHIQNELPIYLL